MVHLFVLFAFLYSRRINLHQVICLSLSFPNWSKLCRNTRFFRCARATFAGNNNTFPYRPNYRYFLIVQNSEHCPVSVTLSL